MRLPLCFFSFKQYCSHK